MSALECIQETCPEILVQILSHINSALDLTALSRTSQKLHALVTSDGVINAYCIRIGFLHPQSFPDLSSLTREWMGTDDNLYRHRNIDILLYLMDLAYHRSRLFPGMYAKLQDMLSTIKNKSPQKLGDYAYTISKALLYCARELRDTYPELCSDINATWKQTWSEPIGAMETVGYQNIILRTAGVTTAYAVRLNPALLQWSETDTQKRAYWRQLSLRGRSLDEFKQDCLEHLLRFHPDAPEHRAHIEFLTSVFFGIADHSDFDTTKLQDHLVRDCAFLSGSWKMIDLYMQKHVRTIRDYPFLLDGMKLLLQRGFYSTCIKLLIELSSRPLAGLTLRGFKRAVYTWDMLHWPVILEKFNPWIELLAPAGMMSEASQFNNWSLYQYIKPTFTGNVMLQCIVIASYNTELFTIRYLDEIMRENKQLDTAVVDTIVGLFDRCSMLQIALSRYGPMWLNRLWKFLARLPILDVRSLGQTPATAEYLLGINVNHDEVPIERRYPGKVIGVIESSRSVDMAYLTIAGC